MRRCYFDSNATTPLDPVVAEVFLETLKGTVGNASSIHSEGQAARHLVERSRRAIAALWGISPKELVFTSGGTEADNLALRGVVGALDVASDPVERLGVAGQHQRITCCCCCCCWLCCC